MTDFRIVEHIGHWFLEVYRDGAWHIYAGPFKLRKSAEARLKRETAQ